MPGPHEANLSIDSYLLPLIEELSKCYNEGIRVPTPSGIYVNIRSCISCDIPATRKVAGFLGHNARLGCNKCYKEFVDSLGAVDYSGYDRSLWNPRTARKHRSDCLKVETCKTKSDKKNGIRTGSSTMCTVKTTLF